MIVVVYGTGNGLKLINQFKNMKYFILSAIIISTFVLGCTAQKNLNKQVMFPEIDNKFEKFDIVTFEKESTLEKRTVTTESYFLEEDTQSSGYVSVKYPNNSVFSIVKLFYKNGNIREKGIQFNNGSEYGIWYKFDESGKLTEEENTDEGYQFSWDDVVEYCKKNKIKLAEGYPKGGWQTEIFKETDGAQNIWKITYQVAGELLNEVTLDSNTGSELSKREIIFSNN